MSVFSSLETIRHEKNIELIYDMDATIPREVRGDFDVLLRLLSKMLAFVFSNTDKREIILSLGAPEDFLYEELMSFKIKETNIPKEKLLGFLETSLSNEIEILKGKIVDESTEDIHLEIPFKINELGYRRHYRLPHLSMLKKKVLLLCASEKVSQNIEKMFKYFLYDVEVGLDVYKSQGNDLTSYDILLIEDSLSTDALNEMITKVQENIPLKYVILRDSHIRETGIIPSVTTHLIKPVTQENIFELIVSLYKDVNNHHEIKSNGKKNIVDVEKFLQVKNTKEANVSQGHSTEETLHAVIENKKELILLVLDKDAGEENTKKMGLNYAKELKSFLDTFDRSDIYFRQIVNEKAIHKIKEFCIDLEKRSKLIGAKSMLKFADIVSLIFVYNKLDMLPIYPGKYHLELEKLMEEIKSYLGIKK